jgi:hypothetical protein
MENYRKETREVVVQWEKQRVSAKEHSRAFGLPRAAQRNLRKIRRMS